MTAGETSQFAALRTVLLVFSAMRLFCAHVSPLTPSATASVIRFSLARRLVHLLPVAQHTTVVPSQMVTTAEHGFWVASWNICTLHNKPFLKKR